MLLAGCGAGAADAEGEGDVAAFCDRLLELDAAPPPEPGGNSASELEELASVGPAEIRGDVRTVADHHRDAYVEGDPSTDSFDAMPSEVQDAIRRLDAFATEHCPDYQPM